MFFIFGSPRSGTTLLAQSLDSHSALVIPHETDFIIPMAFLLDRIADPGIGRELLMKLITNSAGFPQSLGEYLTAQTIQELIYSCEYAAGALLKCLYAEVARRAGAQWAGDKSPNDLLFLRILVKVGGLTPDTKIVHLVRDVRDVMVSLNERGWVSDADAYFPRFWANSNLYLHYLYKDRPAQYCLLRYEDLVREPAAQFTRVCRFLGVEYQAEMLDSERRHPRYHRMAHHRRLFEPITAARIGVYRERLSPAQLHSYERQAGEAMDVFGYHAILTTSHPIQPAART